jgi:hypothetical protein
MQLRGYSLSLADLQAWIYELWSYDKSRTMAA